MSLPIIVLSVVPAIVSLYVSGNIKSILLFICWINTIISASDIYNSLLIAIKPKNSIFCRGYYKVEDNKKGISKTFQLKALDKNITLGRKRPIKQSVFSCFYNKDLIYNCIFYHYTIIIR